SVLLSRTRSHPDLRSFPTRRSSDLAKTFAESLSCCRRGIFAYQRIEHAFFRRLFSARPNFPALVFANKGKSHLDEIANDGLHVTPDVADLGEFRRFNLDERRVGELCETARNLRFADTRWPNHQNVFRQNLFSQVLAELLTAPAVAQCDGDSPLGLSLANDVAVQLGDDLAR